MQLRTNAKFSQVHDILWFGLRKKTTHIMYLDQGPDYTHHIPFNTFFAVTTTCNFNTIGLIFEA